MLQDTARNFGGSKASQELYRVFMAATQFEAIIEHLKLAEVEVEKMKARKKDLQKTVKVSSAAEPRRGRRKGRAAA